MEYRLCLVSPEWAPDGLDPESLKLLPTLVGVESPPVEGSRRKVLRLLALLELRLAGKLVPVWLLSDPVPDVARMARPPVLAHCAKGVTGALSVDSPLSH